MTLLFNLENLEKLTKNDPVYFVKALEYWHNKVYIPKNASQKYKPLKQSIHGNSFLVNPDDLFSDKLTDVLYIVQYIKLAARRSYAMYKLYGRVDLDLSFLPDINIQNIKHNNLLTIKNNYLHFKYEDKKVNGTLI
jgi:hypothetical protein